MLELRNATLTGYFVRDYPTGLGGRSWFVANSVAPMILGPRWLHRSPPHPVRKFRRKFYVSVVLLARVQGCSGVARAALARLPGTRGSCILRHFLVVGRP
jgi:hypothetical protein